MVHRLQSSDGQEDVTRESVHG